MEKIRLSLFDYRKRRNHPKKNWCYVSGMTRRVFCISSPVRKNQTFNSQTKFLKEEGAKMYLGLVNRRFFFSIKTKSYHSSLRTQQKLVKLTDMFYCTGYTHLILHLRITIYLTHKSYRNRCLNIFGLKTSESWGPVYK